MEKTIKVGINIRPFTANEIEKGEAIRCLKASENKITLNSSDSDEESLQFDSLNHVYIPHESLSRELDYENSVEFDQ